jgi:hypothetical protein
MAISNMAAPHPSPSPSRAAPYSSPHSMLHGVVVRPNLPATAVIPCNASIPRSGPLRCTATIPCCTMLCCVLHHASPGGQERGRRRSGLGQAQAQLAAVRPHIASLCFKYFSCFIGMFQVFYIAKVDPDVAYVANVPEAHCKAFIQNVFQTYVCKRFLIWMLHMFHTCCKYVPMILAISVLCFQ